MTSNKTIKDLLDVFKIADEDTWWSQIYRELGTKTRPEDLQWIIEDNLKISPSIQMYPLLQPIIWRTRHDWQIAEKWFPSNSESQDPFLAHLVDEYLIEYEDLDSFKAFTAALPMGQTKTCLQIKPHQEELLAKTDYESFNFVLFSPQTDEFINQLNREEPAYPWRSAMAPKDLSPSNELSHLCLQIINHLSQTRNSTSEWRVYLEIKDQYLTEIAKIRALKILLLNLWRAYHLPLDTCPQIHAQITIHDHTDLYTNLIASSSMALAVATAGVDAACFILPKSLPNRDELNRLTRNIHYILKYESHLTHRLDPLAGSSVVEELTGALANRVWKKIGGMDQ